MEIWKTIEGFENYEISNFGNVRSIERYTKGRFSFILRKQKIIKPQLRERYLSVGLYNNSKFNSNPIHRLVALHFVDNPENKPQVNHIDGNKLNNHYTNLEWCTAKENIKHSYDIGIRKIGENHHLSKLNENDILEIRENKNNLTQKELGLIYGVTHFLINRIVTKKEWAQVK